MRKHKAIAIFKKVKNRFFKDQLNDYTLEIIPEPLPYFNGKNCFVDCYVDERVKTIYLKSWAVRRSRYTVIYAKFIHEFSHAVVGTKISNDDNCNHKIEFANECFKHYSAMYKKRSDLKYVLRRDSWWTGGKFEDSKKILIDYGLYKP